VHDTVDLEARGLPAVYVATVQFVDGGLAQAKSLGADVAAVFVAHPIQDRTDAELVALADGAIAELVAKLTPAS
jgi:hypothetical protein